MARVSAFPFPIPGRVSHPSTFHVFTIPFLPLSLRLAKARRAVPASAFPLPTASSRNTRERFAWKAIPGRAQLSPWIFRCAGRRYLFILSVLERGIFKLSRSKHFYVSMDKPNMSNQRTEAEYV